MRWSHLLKQHETALFILLGLQTYHLEQLETNKNKIPSVNAYKYPQMLKPNPLNHPYPRKL